MTLAISENGRSDEYDSCVERVTRSLQAAERLNPELNAFVSRYDESARVVAEELDRAVCLGRGLSLLGVPVGIKDVFETVEGKPRAQSLVPPAAQLRDALAVSRLRRAGAIVVGKTATTEHAAGFPDPDKPFAPPRNPWNLQRWAGGSSSGSASAVAAGIVPVALGSDTGGSLRVPAAFCGVTAHMPSPGIVPTDGLFPLSPELDRVGPLARSAAHCAEVLGVLGGEEFKPMTLSGGDLRGLRIGVDLLRNHTDITPDPSFGPAFEHLQEVLSDCGAEVFDVSLPSYRTLSNASSIIMLCEALALHRSRLSERWVDYYGSTRGVLSMGAFFSSDELAQARRVKVHVQGLLDELFSRVDAVITPVSLVGATSFGDLDPRFDSLASQPELLLPRAARAMVEFGAVHTRYWNATSSPVTAFPIGFTHDGLPLGAQVAAGYFRDSVALSIAEAFQERTSWHNQKPYLFA